MRIFAELRRAELSRSPRAGATLLELLTVIVVLMMITSATIPVVAPHAEGRRIREGARMVSTFINAGRTRAVETGRATGVWIERMPNVPEAANMLFFAEIPPVYAGDFLDSTVECCVVGRQSGTTTWPHHIPPLGDQEYYNIVIPRNRTEYQTDIWANADPSTHQLVRQNDLIRFEGIDRFYNLNIVQGLFVPNSNGQNTWWYIAKGINADTPDATSYNNNVDLSLRYDINWFTGPTGSAMSSGSVVQTTTDSMNRTNPGLRYQIYRQPVRLQAGSIRLPEGVVIDLNFSSITSGSLTRYYEPSDDYISDPGTPLHPRLGPNVYYTEYGFSFSGPAVYPEDNSPIVFVFTPDGRVQRIYRQTKESSGPRWSWMGSEPFGNVFLLIGERRCIVPHETSATYAQQIKKNWTNLNALWVRLNCQTGFTATALLDDLTSTAAAANPDGYLRDTRSKARAARTLGGR